MLASSRYSLEYNTQNTISSYKSVLAPLLADHTLFTDWTIEIQLPRFEQSHPCLSQAAKYTAR